MLASCCRSARWRLQIPVPDRQKRCSCAWTRSQLGNNSAAMSDVVMLLVKGLFGGCLVAVFALLSESVSPKRFGGLFGAAPAVAIAGLAITLLDKGARDAHLSAVGMIAGAVGMIAYAAVAVPLLRRMRAS